MYIYANYRHPHHLVASTWGIGSILSSLLLIILSVIVRSTYLYFIHKDEKLRFFLIEALLFILSWITALGIMYVGVEKLHSVFITTPFGVKCFKYVGLIAGIWYDVVSLLSALLFMMCPLAIAESVTTQTDLMATMWVIVFAYFALLIGLSDKSLLNHENVFNIVFCACSIGFGWLTKSSVCFIMPVVLLWLFIVCIKRKEKVTAMLCCMILALSIIVVLALPGFIRNYRSTGNIFAFEQMAGNLLVKTVNPKLLLLNVCKNMTLEMAGTTDPDPMWKATMKLADKMGIDIEAPEISAYRGFADGRSCTKSYHHDTAGAQMLMIVIGISVLLAIGKLVYCLIIKKKKIPNKLEETYLWAILCAGGIMFICIRWQPWGHRLLFPALALFCIFVGCVISTIFENKNVRIILILATLIVLFPDAYHSVKKQTDDYAKPVWAGEERFDGYFKNRNECLDMYKEIVSQEAVAEASEIGLLLGGDTYEYPLWVVLKRADTTIHHVLPESDRVNWYPGCIISIGNREIEKDSVMKYGDKEYQCIWNFEDNDNYSILILKA